MWIGTVKFFRLELDQIGSSFAGNKLNKYSKYPFFLILKIFFFFFNLSSV